MSRYTLFMLDKYLEFDKRERPVTDCILLEQRGRITYKYSLSSAKNNPSLIDLLAK